MKKKTSEQFSSNLEQESSIKYVKWMENNVVSVASTCFGVQPVRPINRFIRKDKLFLFQDPILFCIIIKILMVPFK